jgi:hypothetical protein
MHRKKARFTSCLAAVAIVCGMATLAPRGAYAHAV